MTSIDCIFVSRRPEENPLDLNNLPDDCSRDGKEILLEDASSVCRKKKSSGKYGKDECGKVYECRFCSLKFCKSQALGGHMNRHRQERETETLNHARQLVFRNDHSIIAQGATHLGCCQPAVVTGGSYNNVGGGDPPMSLRFPTNFFVASSSSQPSQPYSFPRHHHPVSDYYVGHALNNNNHHSCVGSSSTGGGEFGYNCTGALVVGHGRGDGGSLMHSHGYSAAHQHRLDHPPSLMIYRQF